ncbi:hypothetical protein [Gloeothece verrucosa]|uniref:Uncharacterized protein n=1 Tax=Gloeothece verrucosa (strain PCC 7822) TaxID=497965 RepID=E0U6I0_GLOV7|nr:hypothetical protein [Gloeothece verrucosa]ADN13623.1 hypothetical protein Cyan7822_1632 [Gloeothece verrucosa PCC 7822]
MKLSHSLTVILSSVALLTGLTLIHSPESRANEAPTEKLIAQSTLDPHAADVADAMFWYFHPELEGKRIQPDQTDYIREWMALYKVADRFNLPCWQCGGPFIEDLPVNWADQIADAVFYARHPELHERKIRPQERELANEWAQIRCSINTSYTTLKCEQFGF